VLTAAVMFLGLAACGSGSSSSSTSAATQPAGAGPVKVTEKDFKLDLATTSAKAGKVSFSVHNLGPSEHEFVVFQTDLAPDKLPTKSDGNVDEEGAGVKHIDEIGGIKVGKTEPLSIDLTAGRYVVICNLDGHYAAGMHEVFTVTG
jgi:uncharacterized cupredoxin-like copper-binding protein